MEPNGQGVGEVHVGLSFDPALLEIVPEATSLNPSSPLNEPIGDILIGDGAISLAAKVSGSQPPTGTFTFANVTFAVSGVGQTTDTVVSFISQGDAKTRALADGLDVTDELFTSTITIQGLTP